MQKQEMMELAEIVAKSVVTALKENGLVGKADEVVKCKPKNEKTAYQKCEQLLFNYNGFKRIVADKKQEIADLRRYGVPGKSASAGGERVCSSRTNVGIVLPEDAVEDAVRQVEKSYKSVVEAINLIDNGLSKIKNDPYYQVIPMRYFEGRTLEDIGVTFGCEHSTISRNKARLVKELALWLFPNDVVDEYMS